MRGGCASSARSVRERRGGGAGPCGAASDGMGERRRRRCCLATGGAASARGSRGRERVGGAGERHAAHRACGCAAEERKERGREGKEKGKRKMKNGKRKRGKRERDSRRKFRRRPRRCRARAAVTSVRGTRDGTGIGIGCRKRFRGIRAQGFRNDFSSTMTEI